MENKLIRYIEKITSDSTSNIISKRQIRIHQHANIFCIM